ncbi:MAG: ABC transporter ATP-binding protein [Leptolyngbya sp.]|nr:ABC transporter ATP-binding protein [Candidatus Melainabacteria bacterium]
MNSPVLNISKLSFGYNNRLAEKTWVIRELNLSVSKGEIVCILGASGCGKSTLLNLIEGLLQPISGEIQIVSNADRKRPIGYIFQQDPLLPWRTVESNLMLVTDLSQETSKIDARENIKQYLETFNLNQEILQKYPSQLSGGMRQRVSIIQSLMFNPDLILLDEPFSALDFFTKLKLESEFCHLITQKEKSAILVTHDIEEAVAMGNRVLIMNTDGALIKSFEIEKSVEFGSPENARGTAKFAEYYRLIWSELKAVISNE